MTYQFTILTPPFHLCNKISVFLLILVFWSFFLSLIIKKLIKHLSRQLHFEIFLKILTRSKQTSELGLINALHTAAFSKLYNLLENLGLFALAFQTRKSGPNRPAQVCWWLQWQKWGGDFLLADNPWKMDFSTQFFHHTS